MWLMYSLIVIMFFLSLLRKSSKYVNYAFIILMGLMFVFVYENADTELYRLQYYASTKFDWTDTEPLWMILQTLGVKLKLSFEMFRCCVFGVSIYLVFKRINQFASERNLVLVLYLVYPFLIDMSQMRNFLAMSILVYAIPFLAEKTEKSLLKYIALILISTLIHNVFVFYIVLVFLWFWDVNLKVFSYILLISAGVILYFKDRIPSLVMYFFKNYHNGGFALKYVNTSGVSTTMGMFLAFYYLMLFLSGLYVNYVLNERRIKELFSEEKLLVMNIYNKSIVILTLTVILTLFSTDFLRISRNMMFIQYALMLEVTKYNTKAISKVFYRFLMLVIVIMATAVFIYYSYPDTVFYPGLENNRFFEWFNFY